MKKGVRRVVKYLRGHQPRRPRRKGKVGGKYSTSNDYQSELRRYLGPERSIAAFAAELGISPQRLYYNDRPQLDVVIQVAHVTCQPLRQWLERAGYPAPSPIGIAVLKALKRGETLMSLESASGVSRHLIAQYVYNPDRRPSQKTCMALAPVLRLSDADVAAYQYSPKGRKPRSSDWAQRGYQTRSAREPGAFSMMARKAGSSKSRRKLRAAKSNLEKGRKAWTKGIDPEVLAAYVNEGLSNPAIAVILGCSTNVVRDRKIQFGLALGKDSRAYGIEKRQREQHLRAKEKASTALASQQERARKRRTAFVEEITAMGEEILLHDYHSLARRFHVAHDFARQHVSAAKRGYEATGPHIDDSQLLTLFENRHLGPAARRAEAQLKLKEAVQRRILAGEPVNPSRLRGDTGCGYKVVKAFWDKDGRQLVEQARASVTASQ